LGCFSCCISPDPSLRSVSNARIGKRLRKPRQCGVARFEGIPIATIVRLIGFREFIEFFCICCTLGILLALQSSSRRIGTCCSLFPFCFCCSCGGLRLGLLGGLLIGIVGIHACAVGFRRRGGFLPPIPVNVPCVIAGTLEMGLQILD